MAEKAGGRVKKYSRLSVEMMADIGYMARAVFTPFVSPLNGGMEEA